MSVKNINMVINTATLYYVKTICDTVEKTLQAIIEDNKLCIGKDSIKFEAKPTVTGYDFAGKLDREFKEMEDITGWEVKVEGTAIDFSDKVMEVSLMEQKNDDSNKYTIYVPKNEIDSYDYGTLIIVGKVRGKETPVIVVINNSYNKEGLSFETKDKDNAAVKLTFNGAYDLEDPELRPFQILTPKIDDSEEIAKA